SQKAGYPLKTRLDLLRWLVTDQPEMILLGHQYWLNERDYGAPNWYDWCVAHWGTKWNSYVGHFEDLASGYFEFSTAWSVPEPIFAKLAEILPEHTIEIHSEDEGGGFTATTWIENGQSVTEYFDALTYS